MIARALARARRVTTLVVLGLMVAACTRPIDASTVAAFEKTLAENKRLLHADDQVRLENSIFVIAEYDLFVSSGDSALEHATRLTPDLFVDDFKSAWKDSKQEPTSGIIMDSARATNLNVTDPVAQIVEHLITAREGGLRAILGRADEIVALSNVSDGAGGCRFDLENDTKWPITGIEVATHDRIGGGGRYGYHKFDPPLRPAQRESLVLQAVGCPFLGLSATRVQVVGHPDFAPVEKSEWLKAKPKLEQLEKMRSKVSARLVDVRDWLRGVH